MGRLFWKFFFFIWLAQLTAVAGIGGTLWLKHRSDALEDEADRRAAAAQTINAAATALQFGGLQTIRNLAENLYRYRIFLIDEKKQDVFGRPVGADDVARAQASLGQAQSTMLARKVVTPDRHEYLFFLGDARERMRRMVPRGAGAGFGGAMAGGFEGGRRPGVDGAPPAWQAWSPDAQSQPGQRDPRGQRAPGFGPQAGPRPPDMQGPAFFRWYLLPDSLSRSFMPFMAGLIASLVFAALLARYFATPIRTLRNAFEAIADGKLDTRVADKMGRRRDELADLGRDFDAMAGRFGALVDGQQRLLHDVSHELRSPLARLQVAIGLARQQPQKIEGTMLRIERESERMDQLVGELLTLSRVEVGVVQSGREAVNIAELLGMVVDNADFEAAAGGKRVLLDGECPVTVSGHFELLYRAVENVVRNAVKHTLPGGDVMVSTAFDAHELRLTVQDRGPGVSEAELRAIFEPFFRGGGEFRNSNGYGLGLAIARRVVLAHGGAITADNDEHGGLRVEIVLPLAAAQPA